MQDMTVNLSDEDFEFLYVTLRRVNTPYSHDDAADIVRLEREAWELLQEIAEAQDVVIRTADQPE